MRLCRTAQYQITCVTNPDLFEDMTVIHDGITAQINFVLIIADKLQQFYG